MSARTTPGMPGFSEPRGPVAAAADEDARAPADRVRWGAICAGVAVGMIVQILLTDRGFWFGVARLAPTDDGGAAILSTASGIWRLNSGIAAAGIGGCVAAWMSGKAAATTGALTARAFIAPIVPGANAGWGGGRFGGVQPVFADRMIPARRPLA